MPGAPPTALPCRGAGSRNICRATRGIFAPLRGTHTAPRRSCEYSIHVFSTLNFQYVYLDDRGRVVGFLPSYVASYRPCVHNT